MKKYSISLRGHVVVFADSEKEAFKIVDCELKNIHQKYNLSSYKEL